MKSLIRKTAIYGLSLFFLAAIVPGVKITGGVPTYILGGFVLTLMSLLIKPLLNLFALPLTIITMGTFSLLINAVILYLLTVFVSKISVNPFSFAGTSFAGFIVPKISFNAFFSYVLASFVLSAIITFINWLRK